jgi:predicted RNA polymerase sigma factor
LDEARIAFRLAAELTGNGRERALLLARAGALDSSGLDRPSQSKCS